MNGTAENLQNALNTWNEKLGELMSLLTTSPQSFKGGAIWSVIETIYEVMKNIGLALIILFFLMGVMKTCGTLAELKRPEVAVHSLLRFVIALGLVTSGMDIMLFMLKIAQGVVSSALNASGVLSTQTMLTVPDSVLEAIAETTFLNSIGLFLVSLLGGIFITLMSFIMIMTVYGRFFKLYLYTALSPLALATFAGQPTDQIGKSFLRSFAGVCLEGAVIVLACVVFSGFVGAPPEIDSAASANSQVWTYVCELLFNMLVLVGTIKMSDRVIREMTGL